MMLRVFVLLATFVAPLGAEERAQVLGAVRDASEESADATITVVNEDTGIRRSTHADANGDYIVAALPAGLYKVTVRKPGFQTIAQLNVHLNPAQNARLDFTMQVGSMREVITIEAAPPLLNAADASVATVAGQQLLEGLPLNGRGVMRIIDLAPGVVTTPATLGEAGQFSANGQRPNANYFTVDGVSANTGVSGSVTPAQFSGGTLPSMTAFGTTQTLSPAEGIEEIRVQTSSFAPEFGRAPGANVGITTRAGTNELHGSAFYTGRHEALDANNWFANAAGLGRASAALNNWGASIGGPLRRDRTFFFADYEGLRLTEPFTWRTAVPSLASRRAAPPMLQPVLAAYSVPNGPDLGSGLAEFVANGARPSQLDLGSLRIDHALTSRIGIFSRYQRAPSSTASGFAQVDHSHFENDSLTLGASVLASPNVTSDFRFNFTRVSVNSYWVATGAGGSAPVDLSKVFPQQVPSGTVLYGFAIGGVGDILAGEASHSRQDQWNAIETLAWNQGGHAVRGGIDYNRLSPFRDRLASTIAGTYRSLSDLLTNQPLNISTSQADRASSMIETLALFAQDTWRITRRLTATYGIRWELTPAPAFRFGTPVPGSGSTGAGAVPPVPPGQPGTGSGTSAPPPSNPGANAATTLPIWPTRYTQFAPRAGIAYQITPATVLRAGWGIFYDVEFGVATDPINSFPYNRWQLGLAFPGVALAPVVPAYSGYGYAPNLKLPYSREWNVSLEHAFRGVDVVSASYVGSAGRRLLRREATLPPADSQIAMTPIATNNGRSDFEALELQYRRKLTSGLQGLASYTWSHSLDNGSWDSGIYRLQNVSSDRGPSSFDVRHSFSAGLNWRAPLHWTLSTFITARSGFPIDILASENQLGLGFDDFKRPDLVSGVPVWIPDPNVPGGQRLNPAAFKIPSGAQQGGLGRNSITGFGLGQVDLALDRKFALREEAVMELRLEAFNVTNRAQFGDPVRYLNSPLFGQPVSMLNLMLGSGTPHSGMAPAFQAGAPRILQATIRFRF